MFFVLYWFPLQCTDGDTGTDHYYNLRQNIATWSWWQSENSAQNLKVRTGWTAYHNCLCNYKKLFRSFQWLNVGMSGSGSPHSEIPDMQMEKPAISGTTWASCLRNWGKFQHNWVTAGSSNLCLELLIYLQPLSFLQWCIWLALNFVGTLIFTNSKSQWN